MYACMYAPIYYTNQALINIWHTKDLEWGSLAQRWETYSQKNIKNKVKLDS